MPDRAVFVALAVLVQSAAAAAQPASWLDRPIARWHTAGGAIPSPPRMAEPKAAIVKRCAAIVATGSPADALLDKAGWVPFLHVDRRHTRDDVEVVGGLAAAGPSCEPASFNLFVFVGGRFAGALSPSPMQTARDGVAGPVRLTAANALTAEFARYTAADAECCPSSVVRVTYRIDRQSPSPAVEAVEVRPVR